MRDEWKDEVAPPTLSVWTNGTEWFIAYSEEDAKQALIEHMGWKDGDYDEDMLNGDHGEWEMLPGGKLLGICMDQQLSHRTRGGIMDDCSQPGKPLPKNFQVHVRATCSEWVKAQGRGFLASTEY